MTGGLPARSDDHPRTVLDAFVAALRRAGDYNPEAEVAPLAILWPDGTRQWERALPALHDDHRLTVLTLGDYDPDARTGPAIWVRAELAILPAPAPGDPPPVVYLPGHHREVFRDAEAAPVEIRPLFGLHVRGTLFLQPNGKDWTVAFLQNARYGLGLTVDRGDATRAALGNTVKDLLSRQVAELRRHPGGIDAGFLDSILIRDMPRLVLDWLNEPAAIRADLDETTWSAFARQLHGTYGVDPDRDGPGEAARRLGESDTDHQWAVVWSRFEQSWDDYPAIPAALRGARPARSGRGAVQRGIFGPAAGSGATSHWPQDNEADEETLRDALTALGDANASAASARQAILDLEAAHAPRSASVWAKRGEAPLARAFDHLAAVARGTADPFPAKDLATMVAHYVETGWRAAAAALDAQGAVRTAADREAVAAALDRIYSPWLWDTAERFQEAIKAAPDQGRPRPHDAAPGTCVLFADGLRFDLAARLAEGLEREGNTVTITGAVGPLPGVTPSAKPAQSPVSDRLAAGPKLNVIGPGSGSAMTQAALRKLLADAGWTYLGPGDIGAPDGTGRAWTESGTIDSYGHNQPQDLPAQAHREVVALRERVAGLLAAGWTRVVVITDHGWLLTPRPMPKTDLPVGLTVEKKGRTARLEIGATTDVQTVAWCWDPSVMVAMAPGISCFEEGKRYEHGGLSPQECVVPTLVATAPASVRPTATVTIATLAWTGLRCQVTLAGGGPGMAVDVRTRAGDASTSIAARPVPVGDGPGVRVLIGDDAHEGSSATVVVLDAGGQPIAQRATIVGEGE